MKFNKIWSYIMFVATVIFMNYLFGLVADEKILFEADFREFDTWVMVAIWLIIPALIPFFVAKKTSHPVKCVLLSLLSVVLSVIIAFILLLIIGLVYAVIEYPIAAAVIAILLIIAGLSGAFSAGEIIGIIFIDD